MLAGSIERLKGSDNNTDITGNPFWFKISPGNSAIFVILSEYWLEGIDEGEYDLSVEEILEIDRPKAQLVSDVLSAEIGSEYTLELVCDLW